LAKRGDLIAIVREIERSARVLRRTKRLGCIEDAAELEEVGGEARLIGEIAAGRQRLGGAVAERVLVEPVGPAVRFQLGIARERSVSLARLTLRLEPLLALVKLCLRPLQILARVDRALEPFPDRAIGFARGRGQRIGGYTAVSPARICERRAAKPKA
jgi:hypothetical protein